MSDARLHEEALAHMIAYSNAVNVTNSVYTVGLALWLLLLIHVFGVAFNLTIQWASDEQRTLPLSTQRELKNAKWPFHFWKWTFSKKVCYKVSLCENVQRQGFQRQGYKAFTVLFNRAQTVGGVRPFLPEIFGQIDPPLQKHRLPALSGNTSKRVQSLTGTPLRAFRWAWWTACVACKPPPCSAVSLR